MPVRRRPHLVATMAALAIVAGCGSTPVPPSATLGTPDLPASPAVRPSTSASSGPSASASATPSASTAATASPSTASAAPGLEGQIVFQDAGQNFLHSQIWLENADGSQVRQVVADAFTDGGASLSPDGRRIAFYRAFTDSLEAAIADPSLFGTVTVVNIDGSDLHELDTVSRTKRCDVGPEGDAWSPDGTRIAYVRTCFDASAAFVGQGIWTMNADGTDRRQVTRNLPAAHAEDHRVGWSPDGKSLTFERIDTSATPERNAIFTIGADGKGIHQVTPWSQDANDPDWSPDGSLIAFNSSAEPSPTQNIYTIHPDGSGLTKLTTYDEVGQATFHPTWSPDGTQILFSHSPSTGGWADFFVMDRDGANQRVITKSAIHENQGNWGPAPAP